MTFTYQVITPWGRVSHAGEVNAKNERGARIAVGKRHFVGYADIVVIKEKNI